MSENNIAADEELLSSKQAVYIALFAMFATSLGLYFYKKRLSDLAKEDSLAMRYNFAFPPEKHLYEKKILEEPENEAEKENWRKEISAILMRRAIMSLSLNIKVSQDYRGYFLMYQGGINLDIWESVKKAKEMVDKEIRVIQQEAEWIKPGWGALIFSQAGQLRQHMMMKQAEEMKKKEEEEQKQKQQVLEKDKTEKAYKKLLAEETARSNPNKSS